MMAGGTPETRKTWLGSDRRLARAFGRPVIRFLGIEAAGGILLMAATLVALVWANSPWSDSYHDLWHAEVHLSIGGLALEHLQSNHEGDLVDAVQAARGRCAGIVVNPGAFTHYAWAVHDLSLIHI